MLGIAIALGALAPVASGQTVERKITADDPAPPVTYHGLIPGLSKTADVRTALGSPVWEAEWYAYKMLYPAQGRSGMYDSIHVTGKDDGHFATVEAASVPEGLTTRSEIEAKLGEPEYELRMATFKLLDYSQQGVRFVVDKEDKTIGVAYFPHLRARVHDGARKLVDLSLLRQGPQPHPAEPASLEGLRAGAAEIKITPLEAEWLDPRYREKYQPHDDLYARAVVFEKGDTRVALVGADLFGMSLTTIEPIIARVKEAGIEHIVIAASHNHAAPDTIGVYGHYPAEYNQYIQDQVVKCVGEAYANLRPVKELRTASRELPMDGARVAGLIRNARNVGLVDPTISMIQPIGEDDQPIATLVNFACHVEGIEAGVLELTADFPGYMCEQIKADGGGVPVFLNGAVGGMISGDNRARTHEEAKSTGLAFAAIVKDLEKSAQPPSTFDFSVETKRVEIPMTNASFKPLYEQLRPLNRGRVVTQMSLIKLGECEMVTLPGEVLPEVAVEILEHMHGFPRILIGLANDQLGYIIPPEDFRDDEYEETMSQGPAAAPVVRDTAIRLLEGVK